MTAGDEKNGLSIRDIRKYLAVRNRPERNALASLKRHQDSERNYGYIGHD